LFRGVAGPHIFVSVHAAVSIAASCHPETDSPP